MCIRDRCPGRREREAQKPQNGGQSGSPFVLLAESRETGRDIPINKRRLAIVDLAAMGWHDPVVGFQHVTRRKNAPGLFAADFVGAQKRQVQPGPNQGNEGDGLPEFHLGELAWLVGRAKG